jgi:hypothetical protein
MDLIHMAGQGQAAEFCAHGNKIPDSTNERNFLTSWETISF